ncbi:diguanylate cyclase [Thalassobacillus hwangdonensis]|uniref:Diguanylate cyclase n=1 Tax=Thalassobacillus hwangdonensis TaxID=546108 RepID=A0ABW3L3Q4_9BACI
MVSDLVINVSLLMSFTFVWHQLFRNNRLTFSTAWTIKVVDGVIAGLLGIILMHYSIAVNDITILDLRHIPVILVAYYGGFFPAFVASLVIVGGRFFIDVNFSSYVALFMMLAIAIGAGWITHGVKAGMWRKWTYLLIYSQAVFSLALYIVVDSYSNVLDYAFYHVISTFIGGYLTLYFVEYIRGNSERYLEYKKNALKDSLTGLYNVRAFDQYYNEMIKETKETAGTCGFFLLDIDYFKNINDTHGHTAGDEMLKQFAQVVQRTLRAGDKLCRNGGEEFSVLLYDCEADHVEEIANRIRRKVEAHPFRLPDGKKINFTVSIGVATFNGQPESKDDLFQQADDALYNAKQNGRNLVYTSTG